MYISIVIYSYVCVLSQSVLIHGLLPTACWVDLPKSSKATLSGRTRGCRSQGCDNIGRDATTMATMPVAKMAFTAKTFAVMATTVTLACSYRFRYLLAQDEDFLPLITL